MRPPPAAPANPGPGWGPAFLLWAVRRWPRWLFRPALMGGTWVALAFMPAQRAHSRAYLEVILGRPVRTVELWRHFLALIDSLLINLRAGAGESFQCELDPEHGPEFDALLASGRQALFGTFHFGLSDLLGYLLAEHGRNVSMLRLHVDNSHDTTLLGRRYGEHLSILWVNDPASLIFELKSAVESGRSLALKCDRLEFSAKAEPFRFLGADRIFPFTIYHLAMLFGLPVVFCVALPAGEERRLKVFASPVFAPDPDAGREANLRAARAHFQDVLTALEARMRAQPFQWFNFLPLNPPA